MSFLKAILIDDEQDSVSLLQLQLQKHCPQISTIHVYNNPVKALAEIELLQPDILFLDIEMPEMNGFQLLEKLVPLKFKVIFITAYNQYAIRAFRFNALDYLVKPVSTEDLVEAVEKVLAQPNMNQQQLGSMQKQMNGEPINKIAVTTHGGVSFINLSDIVYAEANSNYSKFMLTDGSNFVISKTLKDIQDILEERHFFRIHRQYIINLNKVKHFNKVDCILTMDNKAELPVARIQKDKLIEKFGWL